MSSIKLKLLVCFLLLYLLPIYPVHADVKIFDKTTKWCASKDQSQSQAEKLAVLEAQQQAIEEAGVFISSLTVVKDYKLEKDEITKLASAILQTKTPDTPALFLENNTYCVQVRTIIQVDTSTLNPQIEAFMKDKGAQKKADEDAKTIRELKEQMANLKSSDVKHLEEMNAQAIAVEREREKQRLLREEQAIKARRELTKAEEERFTKEREMQDRISRTLADQAKVKREEAAALVSEQDRIKRAQLENEQRWNDLSRKATITQESWVAIDDSLSLKQALTEVKDLKREIANLKGRLDYQYNENTKNLETAYAQQRSLMTAKLPPEPAPKDAFETTTEYSQRMSAYDRQVKNAKKDASHAVETLKKEETLKLAEAKVDYLGQQIRVLSPFVKRLQDLQRRKFTLLEGGVITVELGEPDADNNRFPVKLWYKGNSWSVWWSYTDRNSAKDFYKTRTYLKAEGLFQIEEATELSSKLTAARVTHLGTKEMQEFHLENPITFAEIDQFEEFIRAETIAEETSQKAKKIIRMHTLKEREIKNGGRFVAYNDGTVLDTRTNLMWAAKDNGSSANWRNAKNYCENYRGGGYTDWRLPTQHELAGLYDQSIRGNNGYHLTTLITLTGAFIWAADFVRYHIISDESAYFHFGAGFAYSTYQSSALHVLPVRDEK